MTIHNLYTYLIYIDEKPFCVLYGSEQDAHDFCERRSCARYEPMVTVAIQHGLSHDVERGA